MKRLFLIPVAVLFAAGGVIAGPGEQAPAAPASTTSNSSHATNLASNN